MFSGPMIAVYVGATFAVLGMLWLLYQHARGTLNLTDAVTDTDEQGVRRASIRKIGEAVALGATTFVLVYSTFEDREANEWIYGLYIGAWVSRSLLGMLAGAKANAINAQAGVSQTPQR